MRAADIIRAEIRERGPIPFERFMDLALYAPGAGYYASARDPFGIHGDFYTAAQLQPVFGILVRRIVQQHLKRLGSDNIIDLGAGRRDMAAAFVNCNYIAVEAGGGLPQNFTGVVFANEFFDALPVRLFERTAQGLRERHVTCEGDGFAFTVGATDPTTATYIERYYQDATLVEVGERALEWVAVLTGSVARGTLLICDYGYTARELPRFPQGTLMTYQRHAASEDVLQSPGERDITAHVAWTPLVDAFVERGWSAQPITTLGRALLDAGEADQFAAVFEGCDASEEQRRRMQLKTLLFGMGEMFQWLTLHK